MTSRIDYITNVPLEKEIHTDEARALAAGKIPQVWLYQGPLTKEDFAALSMLLLSKQCAQLSFVADPKKILAYAKAPSKLSLSKDIQELTKADLNIAFTRTSSQFLPALERIIGNVELSREDLWLLPKEDFWFYLHAMEYLKNEAEQQGTCSPISWCVSYNEQDPWHLQYGNKTKILIDDEVRGEAAVIQAKKYHGLLTIIMSQNKYESQERIDAAHPMTVSRLDAVIRASMLKEKPEGVILKAPF